MWKSWVKWILIVLGTIASGGFLGVYLLGKRDGKQGAIVEVEEEKKEARYDEATLLAEYTKEARDIQIKYTSRDPKRLLELLELHEKYCKAKGGCKDI